VEDDFWNGVSRCFALGQREVPLGRILRDGRWSRRDNGRFVWEEAFEDTLCLPLCCMREVHPDVHATWSAKCWIKTLNMIRRRKQKARRQFYENSGTHMDSRHVPAFCSSHTIKAVEQSTQTQC
jgi:hypothetical protein